MEFVTLAESFAKIESTPSRLDMMAELASLFKKATKDEIREIVYLSQGSLAPAHAGIDIGMGESFVQDAIALSMGYNKSEIMQIYRKLGDLGSVAEELAIKKRQSSLASNQLTVSHVYSVFKRIALMEGTGTQSKRIKYLSELLNNASPIESRYIVRFPLGRLRLGIGDPTILDALSVVVAGDKSQREALERAYNLCSDLGLVAEKLFSEGLEGINSFKIQIFSPIRPALAERLPSGKEIIEKIGKCYVESKYDGFRLQLHVKGDEVALFSRKQERMTHMFPELVYAAKQLNCKEAIIEGEALAYNETTGEFYPFQRTIQRKRKHGVKEMSEEYPLKLFAFDILYLDGVDCTKMPFIERRKKLEKFINESKQDVISVSDAIITDSPEELEKYFENRIEGGLEGIIAKDMNAPYIAGARKFAWIKLKRSYRGELSDTIDLVVVGYFRGKGSRTKFEFGGLLGAVYDAEEDMFKTVARIGSGFSEEQMVNFKHILDKIKIENKPARLDSLIEADFWVLPKYVVRVSADEITKSPNHTCGKKGTNYGYALRFPRIIEDIRDDKRPEDATTVKEILDMYNMQKRVSIESFK